MVPDIDIDVMNNQEAFLAFLKSLQPKSGIFQNNYSYACYVGLYLFALPFCRDRIVLDAACGLGYGSRILATEARQVVGIDLLHDAVDHARRHYRAENLAYLRMDALSQAFRKESFDCVVSIETFEHIPNSFADRFIDECRRVLKPGGLFILSTPNRPVHTQITKVPGHVHEVDVDELHHLTAPRFLSCDFYHQRKNVLNEMKAFYTIVKTDKRKWRRFIPAFLRKSMHRLIARDLTQDIDNLLPRLEVKPASCRDDAKDAAIQVVVCRKEG